MEVSLKDIKKRVLRSFMSLTLRQVVLRAFGFISINLILAKILPIETLGIFNIATAIVTFFAFFSDIGLAASLIQKREVTREDISTTFTIQQVLVGTLSAIIIFGAPLFAQFYGLDENGTWLIRALGIAFFLSSLKVIPSVLLERTLNFGPLVTVEIIETLIFNSILIYLAYQQFGLWSFSWAVLVRGVSGVMLIFLLAPVRLGFGIEKEAARKLLNFGVPYQLNSLLALVKDRLVPLVVARMVGPVGITYITWAQAMAFLPLEVMNIVIRITFPAFSRLQDDKKSLQVAIEKSLFATSLAVYPFIFGLGAILPSVVAYVVSSKFQPAIPAFYLFSFSALWAVISTTFTNVLNATGYVKTTLKLMVFWTISTWILTPVLVFLYGFAGVAMASFLISFSSVITIILVKRILTVRVVNSILTPLLASLSMSIIVYYLASVFVRDMLTLLIVIVMGILIYCCELLLFCKERIFEELRNLRDA